MRRIHEFKYNKILTKTNRLKEARLISKLCRTIEKKIRFHFSIIWLYFEMIS